MALAVHGVEQKMQVGGVNVAVHHDLPVRQNGEARREDRLSRSSFTADDKELPHIAFPILANKFRNRWT